MATVTIDRVTGIPHIDRSADGGFVTIDARAAGAAGAPGATGPPGSSGGPVPGGTATDGFLVVKDTAVAGLARYQDPATSALLLAKYVSKGELVFRVTDYGAVGDMVTSDSAAVNAASAAADAAHLLGRAVVEFPYTPDGYLLSTQIFLYSGVTYRGDRKVLVRRGGATASYVFNCQSLTDITIEGFTLDAAGKTTAGVILCGTGTRVRDNVFTDPGGVQVSSSYDVNFGSGVTPVTDVLVTGNKFVGLRNNVRIRGNTSRVTVEDNDFSGWSSTAIAVDGDDTTCSTDIIIRGNRIHDHLADSRAVTTKRVAANVATLDLGSAPPAAWVVGSTIYVDITDAAYDGNHTLTAVGATSVSWAKTAANSGPTASAGYVTSGNRQPISVQGDLSEIQYHRRITISGNQILGNYVSHQATASGGTADCISVHHTKGLVVSGNIVEGGGDCGIALSFRCQQAVVTGNTLLGMSNCGIVCGASDAQATVRTVTISGNTILNCGQNPVMGSWASTAINLRRTTGALVSGNYLGDDQTVPTQSYGLTLGDTTGTNTDVQTGPNQYVGLVVSKRLTLPGNVRTVVLEPPTTVSKTADTALALNSTTLVADPHLTASLEANAVYEITAAIGYTTNGVAGATPGITVGITVPTGSSAVWWADTSGSNGTGAATTTTNNNRSFCTATTNTINSGGVTGAAVARMLLTLRVTIGTTAGSFTIRAAQQTADAVNTVTTMTGSSMTYRRVA